MGNEGYRLVGELASIIDRL